MFDPDEVRALLVSCARAGEPVTYAEALQAFGHRFTRPKMRQFCRVLADVDAAARGRCEPELAVLVVRQSDGLPGQGWWVAGGAEGYSGAWNGPAARRHVDRLQAIAFAYWGARPSGMN